jgi:plasmid stabilization system protein ParE
MRVEFHPEAIAEFRAAAEYYETQHDGLGSRFIDTVEAAVARVVEAPSRQRHLSGNPMSRKLFRTRPQ